MLDPRARQFRLTRGPRDLRRFDRVVRALQSVGGRRFLRRGPLGLDPRIVALDGELRERVGDLVPRDSRVLQGVPERRRGVDGREHLAARRFDVGLQPLDFAVRRVV